ncbi:MAG: hypothetical protein ACRDVW_04810 [Acidimicrobiales bacterium]
MSVGSPDEAGSTYVSGSDVKLGAREATLSVAESIAAHPLRCRDRVRARRPVDER